MDGLYSRTYACLLAADPFTKVELVKALRASWNANQLRTDDDEPIQPITEPGRPLRPALVSPRNVERRNVSTLEGRAALIHAIAHIEFNAINLALDAAYRFRGLPRAYYGDWISVASEEAHHFTLLHDHLHTLGYAYGSFTAHDGLWDMARKTAHDPLVRMALVPRVLEARGLDASPALIHKMKSCRDGHAVEILETIQHDEVGHVRIGNRWYHCLCAQRGLDPIETFKALLARYDARPRGPFAKDARRQAEFTEAELLLLDELCA